MCECYKNVTFMKCHARFFGVVSKSSLAHLFNKLAQREPWIHLTDKENEKKNFYRGHVAIISWRNAAVLHLLSDDRCVIPSPSTNSYCNTTFFLYLPTTFSPSSNCTFLGFFFFFLNLPTDINVSITVRNAARRRSHHAR